MYVYDFIYVYFIFKVWKDVSLNLGYLWGVRVVSKLLSFTLYTSLMSELVTRGKSFRTFLKKKDFKNYHKTVYLSFILSEWPHAGVPIVAQQLTNLTNFWGLGSDPWLRSVG